MPELFRAHLNPAGPNFAQWHDLLGSDSVPLKSPYPIRASLGPENDVECYLIDLNALTLKARARLTFFLASKFDVPQYKISRDLAEKGMPIRAVDVIVEISMRAMV